MVIEQEIVDTRQQILDCKSELSQAKRIRKNRQGTQFVKMLIIVTKTILLATFAAVLYP